MMLEPIETDVAALLLSEPEVAAIAQISPQDCLSFATLAGALLGNISGSNTIKRVVTSVYTDHPSLSAISHYDIAETTRRNFEPGGVAATMLFGRGAQAIMAHRVAHQLWGNGEHNLALAVKSTLGRALATDIHPAAKIGAGLWLDHGLGFVVGETAVIEEDVSIWHNVTLGSTLNDSGPTRHPQIGRGAVIGAGAVILGNIRVGRGANVAAGAIVVQDVPDQTRVVGVKGRTMGPATISFAPNGTGELV